MSKAVSQLRLEPVEGVTIDFLADTDCDNAAVRESRTTTWVELRWASGVTF